MAKKSKRAVDASLTLAQLSELYLAHMDRAGKSNGTIFSYSMELKSAQAELGPDTLVSEITPELIAAFNESKRVTKLKSGKPKAEPSILKTRRVLRLAFAWATEAGLVERSPYATTDATTETAAPETTVEEPKPAKKRAKREPMVATANEIVAVDETPAA